MCWARGGLRVGNPKKQNPSFPIRFLGRGREARIRSSVLRIDRKVPRKVLWAGDERSETQLLGDLIRADPGPRPESCAEAVAAACLAGVPH